MHYLNQLIEKVNMIDMQVQHLTPLSLHVKETRCFVERSLPLMIHFQLVEGLHVAVLNDLSKLKHFEKTKLKELINYAMDSEAKETFTHKLSSRLKDFSTMQLDSDNGVAPFNLGRDKDFWPEMIEYKAPINKKINYLNERDTAEEEFMAKRREFDDERINMLI